MRNGDIGWLAAVVLAALVGTAPVQAAAPPGKMMQMGDPVPEYPPVPEGLTPMPVPEHVPVPAAPPRKTTVKTDTGWPLDPLEMLPVMQRQSRDFFTAEACLPCPPGFTAPTAREFTIVVRIEEQPYVTGVPDPLSEWKWSFSPPSHAVHRDSVKTFNGEQDTKSVLNSLQQKLMELHEKEWFEVEFSGKGGDRTEMRIRYNPIYPPDTNAHFGRSMGGMEGLSPIF